MVVETIRFDDFPQPKEEKLDEDGTAWIVSSDEPDYMGAGNTLEEARLNYWRGLACTLWLRMKPNERL